MLLMQIYLLTAPGLIALKIKQYFTKEELSKWEFVIEFLILSFVILLLNYMTLYVSYPDRIVSFTADGNIPNNELNVTHIYRAGFVLKYGVTAFIFAIISGICYSFTKINPILLVKEVRKKLHTLKCEASSKQEEKKLF